MKFRRKSKRYARIDVIPLVDIMFSVLMFFMLYASFDAVTVGTGIDVDLPKAATVSAKERDDVIITITKNQQMYFNDKQVSRNELQAYIAEALKDDPDKPIVIKADEQVTYDKIILVMDMVGQAGGYKFLLAAERLQR